MNPPQTYAIKNFSALIPVLEEGKLNRDLTDALEKIAEELTAHADNYGKASGKLVLSLDFKVKDGMFTISADVKVKTPEEPRASSIVWMTAEHQFTPFNPRQMTLFGESQLRDVSPPADGGEVRAV